MPDPLHRVTCHYTGRVQGVGFRQTARRVAVAVPGVAGSVRNLPDGRVELVIEGSPAATRRVLDAVARKMGENIDNVDRTEAPATGEFDAFDVRW